MDDLQNKANCREVIAASQIWHNTEVESGDTNQTTVMADNSLTHDYYTENNEN